MGVDSEVRESLKNIDEKVGKLLEIMEEFKDALYSVFYGGRLGPIDVKVV